MKYIYSSEHFIRIEKSEHLISLSLSLSLSIYIYIKGWASQLQIQNENIVQKIQQNKKEMCQKKYVVKNGI
jgi:hypothetical protein